tara:strand:+ start:535 stop:2220 length:1686 start_codon:yes stop_codon:yes gene_type:complete
MFQCLPNKKRLKVTQSDFFKLVNTPLFFKLVNTPLFFTNIADLLTSEDIIKITHTCYTMKTYCISFNTSNNEWRLSPDQKSISLDKYAKYVHNKDIKEVPNKFCSQFPEKPKDYKYLAEIIQRGWTIEREKDVWSTNKLRLLSNIKMHDDEITILTNALKQHNFMIEELSLCGNDINVTLEKLISALKHCKNLKVLRLRSQGIDDDDVECLDQLQDMELDVLDLSYNMLSSVGICSITSSLNKSLKIFHGNFNEIGNFGLVTLAEFINENELEELYLSACINPDSTFSDYAMSRFTYILSTNKTLRVLDFSSNTLSHLHCEMLFKALEKNETLEVLSIADCNIGHEGGILCSQMLRQNNTLKTIDLSNNNISHKSGIDIMNALQTNSTIQAIDFSNNRAGNSSNFALAVANMLLTNKTLEYLKLQQNFIRIEGSIHIANALSKNNTLKLLDLNSNQITEAGGLAFAKNISFNLTLESLHLSFCGLQSVEIEQLILAKIANHNRGGKLNHLNLSLNTQNLVINIHIPEGIILENNIPEEHIEVQVEIEHNNIFDPLCLALET